MTNFNGDSIIYDEIGNPTQYRDDMDMTWSAGRQLASVTQGANSYSFSYDASGTRISKTVNGTTYSYIYDNGQLIYADTPSGGMTFIYDNDSVIGYRYNSAYYYYLKNIQGDILGVVDASGTLLYQYEYDAWGNHTVLDAQGNTISPDAPHVANFNPLRYRGYFFDTETGLYYLLSRYYDPTTGRFINADNILARNGNTVQGYNVFSYCFNNPINLSDPAGNWPKFIDFFTEVANKVVNTVKTVLSTIAEYAFTVKHDVPLYSQGTTSLCWAYSQVMVEDYQTKTTRTKKEADKRAKEIAISVHSPDNWNKGGWPTNAGEWRSINNIGDLYEVVKSGPVYGYYSGTDSAHLVVITGVNLLRGEVYTNNPWGIAGVQTYEEFLKCFAGGPTTMPFSACILVN